MASDGLTSCVAKTSEPRELTVRDKRFLIFHEEGFQRHLQISVYRRLQNAMIL